MVYEHWCIQGEKHVVLLFIQHKIVDIIYKNPFLLFFLKKSRGNNVFISREKKIILLFSFCIYACFIA